MAWGFNNSASHQAIESFSLQFEPDGNGFLYRRRQKSAPIRVTADERDRFIGDYRRALRRLTWIVAGATILAIVAVSAPAIIDDREVPNVWLWLIGVAAVLVIIPFSIGIWDAPAKILAGRQTQGRERDSSEVRQIRLKQIRWGQLASAALVLPLVLLHMSTQFDIWHGWGLLWPAIASLAMIMVLVQAIRKWQIRAAGN